MKQVLDIQQDTLKFLFTKARASTIPETDALKNNLTSVFFNWIKEKINARELIVIQVRGEVRTGKSTVGITIDWEINKYLEEVGLNDHAKSFMWKWIFSDQTEFLRFINSDERNVGLCIDEFNTMAKTGVNATTEEALFDYYSDVFAGRYFNRVNMGTDVIIDKNTTVILDTIGKDPRNGITRCKLIYRDVVDKQYATLGYVDIDVREITKNWENKGIRDIVETRGIRSLEDRKLVDKWKEKDFYVKYQVKKYRRMELLQKEGIRDIRELEFADIILDCIMELEELASVKAVKADLIMVIVDEVIRKHKRIYSIIAKNEIKTKVSAVLGMITETKRVEKQRRGTKNKNGTFNEPPINERMILDIVIKKLKKDLENRMHEIRHLKELYGEYLNMEG